MSAKSLAYIVLFALPITILSGCQGYRWTLNDQPVYTPPALFTDYKIDDAQLKTCVQETILSAKITAAEQLTQLSCSYNTVSSAQGLAVFTQLQQLDLSHNQLNDIGALKHLDQLQQLDISANGSLGCDDIQGLQDHYQGTLKQDSCSK